MPNLSLRKPEEVPQPSRSSRAVQEQQTLYESFVRQVGADVGELQLSDDESARSVKIRLRRAASRLGSQLEIWDVGNKVYFRAENRPRRGRQRKSE
jgi:hypothetical protein